MKALKEPVDYEVLEEELHDAIREDELYSLRNDAKFRAIRQAVPTYEDFRQMVMAAHLKPLDRSDKAPKIGVKWNSIASDKKDSQSVIQGCGTIAEQRSSVQISVDKIPKSAREFQRMWKRLDRCDERFRLLIESRMSLRNEIFRSEIPPDILADCLVACRAFLKSTDETNVISVIDVLSVLGECNRFELAVGFMSAEDKLLCRELFRSLRQAGCRVYDEKIIDELEKKYLP